MHEFTAHRSELLLDAPILAVRRDQVEMPDGSTAAREIVEHFGAAAVVAYREGGEIALIRQYRHSVRSRLWELPAGLLDVAGESALEAARRELIEEAGLRAERWQFLLDVATSPGYSEEVVRVFLARGLTEVVRPPATEEEADMELAWVSLAEARAMAMRGEIVNAIALSGIFAASEVLERQAQARPVQAEFSLRPRTLADRRIAGGRSGDLKCP